MTRLPDLPVNYNVLSWQERKVVRQEYIRRQNGLCYYCGMPLDGMASDTVMGKWINVKLFPKNFFRWPIHLHHDHATGMTIGVVHCHCNAVMWQYERK